MKKFVAASVLSAIALTAVPTISNAAVTFSDVPQSSTYASYIYDLAGKGILLGNGDGTFAPTQNLTRAQFAVMLTKAFKLNISTKQTKFTDSKTHWARMYIESAYEAGLVAGTSDTTFSPDQSLTREQAAAMVWRYMKANGVASTTATSTLAGNYDSWASDALTNVVGYKLYDPSEVTNGDYHATTVMNREQAAALIDLALNLVHPQQQTSASGGSQSSDGPKNVPISIVTNSDGTQSVSNIPVDTGLESGNHFTSAQMDTFRKYMSEVKFTTNGENITITIPDVGDSSVDWTVTKGIHTVWDGTGGNTVTITNTTSVGISLGNPNTAAVEGGYVLNYDNGTWKAEEIQF